MHTTSVYFPYLKLEVVVCFGFGVAIGNIEMESPLNGFDVFMFAVIMHLTNA